jgi:hypothetical protein
MRARLYNPTVPWQTYVHSSMAAHTLQPSGLVLRLGTYSVQQSVSLKFLTFSICVCPEPVLINDRFFAPGLADLSEDASPDILGGATLGGINPWCETRPFWSQFHVKKIILPRQARDKHRES